MSSAPLSEAIQNAGFPDRVDGSGWPANCTIGALYADMVQSALANIEQTFVDIQINQPTTAATAVWKSRNVHLGVGVNSNARNFTSINRDGSISCDSLRQVPHQLMICPQAQMMYYSDHPQALSR